MSTATKMRLLVVHADAGFRQGLVRGLGLNPWIDVVGAAMSGRTALPKVVSYRPDVVVVDLDQNEAEGLDLLQYLERSHPGILRLAITSPAVQESSASAVARMTDVDVVSRSAGGPDDAALARLVQDVVAPLLRRSSSRVGPGGDPPLRPVLAPDVEIAARP
ncbi:MAG: response regulator, partial [Planctomycetes bacterium]|nr:response regulator [Planctomycetota bacterium]